MARSICISIVRGSVAIWPLPVGLVVAMRCLAATVVSVPTVFVGWGVGLVCDGLSLFSVLCARYMSLLIENWINIRYCIRFFFDWGKASLLFMGIACLYWVL
jgi:hypothetical protein